MSKILYPYLEKTTLSSGLDGFDCKIFTVALKPFLWNKYHSNFKFQSSDPLWYGYSSLLPNSNARWPFHRVGNRRKVFQFTLLVSFILSTSLSTSVLVPLLVLMLSPFKLWSGSWLQKHEKKCYINIILNGIGSCRNTYRKILTVFDWSFALVACPVHLNLSQTFPKPLLW